MNNKFFQGTAAILTIAMTLFCTACGSSNSAAATSAGTQPDTAKGTDGGTGHERPTITFMAPSYYNTDLKNDYSDEVIAKYEEYTNTHVLWQWEADDTYKEKFGLTLMDKDNMPQEPSAYYPYPSE